MKSVNPENFSLLHTNICFLQGNIDKVQSLTDHLDYEFDVIALTKTWHTNNNTNLTTGILTVYQNYECISGLSRNGDCGVYAKNTVPFILTTDLI